MKKNCFFFSAAALCVLLVSCGNKNEYELRGSLDYDGFSNQMVYLYDCNADTIIDSAQLSNKSFAFHGSLSSDQPSLVMLRCNCEATGAHGYLVLEPGNIYIDLITDSLSGTPLNDQLYDVIRQRNANLSKRQQLEELSIQINSTDDTIARNDLISQFFSLQHEMDVTDSTVLVNTYNQHSNDLIGAYAAIAMVQNEVLSEEQMLALLQNAAPVVKDKHDVTSLFKRLEAVKLTSAGCHFVDIDGVDFASGNATKLSAMISGKVALVDFWASWCSPCRAEISQNLIRLYKAYHNAGLEIVGVDVWDKPDAHKDAVAQLDIPYPQLVTEGDAATNAYGIRGIPEIMLVDANGTIIARGLRGDDIETAVKNALNK